jgi:hypothetical protein
MGKQPVIAHANAQASCNPPEEDRQQDWFPGKIEKCRASADVEGGHKESRNPIHRLGKCLVVFSVAIHDPVPFVSGQSVALFGPSRFSTVFQAFTHCRLNRK